MSTEICKLEGCDQPRALRKGSLTRYNFYCSDECRMVVAANRTTPPIVHHCSICGEATGSYGIKYCSKKQCQVEALAQRDAEYAAAHGATRMQVSRGASNV